ncbi:unnamed protein product [Heterosigma akashiwo]|mmetsp:Transcript_8780/g.12272  ORF Transcript_8780/g.12272 Transcript_8780/m.12272 type:complete len:124 (-) Transcript_8780:560-931(-)
MKFFAALIFAALICGSHAFSASSSFTMRPTVAPVVQQQRVSTARANPTMMAGKVAKFGIFSPAVYVVKAAVGEKELNKLRGKGISYHSQAITEFCNYVGAASVHRARLIKLAKTNGDILGFLV